MRADSQLAVALIYPTLLGTYGDGGNASVLARRAEWRGTPGRVVTVDVDDPLPASADIYVLGGGEDSAQTIAVARLAADGTLGRTTAGVFAVCAGFQILGETFLDGSGAVHPGLGLLDARTDRLPGPRAVGELLARPRQAGLPMLTGYENHGGRTTLGPLARPLARVERGIGNGDGGEGATQDQIVATYLHGPALARNPALADLILARVLGPLAPLDDTEEDELRHERLGFVRHRGRWRRQYRPPARA
ncbi:MAG TPA: glutamine amidotransferase [Mycobacteriales bacterium]|nr:glutamine amidotransferase [Mycobacteriales bacterium]